MLTGLEGIIYPAEIARRTGYPVARVRSVVQAGEVEVVCRIGRVPVLSREAAEQVIAVLDLRVARRVPLRPEMDLQEGLL